MKMSDDYGCLISPPRGHKVYDWVRLENGSMLPRLFLAEILRDGLRIELEVETDTDGHSRCLCVLGISSIEPDEAVGAIPPVSALLKVATASASSWMVFERAFEGGWKGVAASAGEARGAMEQQQARNPRRRRDAAPTCEQLRVFARVYEEVSQTRKEGVVEEVASRIGLGRSTAYKRFKAARAAGLLTGT